jgi:hypothetical protein
MSARKPTAIVGLTVRVREALRRELERSAKKREVSLNTEINLRLMRSLRDDRLMEVEAKLDRLYELMTTGVAYRTGKEPSE